MAIRNLPVNNYPIGSEDKFNEYLVEQYLKYGSVEEVFRVNRYSLPISHAGYHRVLNKQGIIKTAGPNSKLTEALEFLTRLTEDNIPLEALYRKMPPSFRTSTTTMYRILSYIKEGITRRMGTALIITPVNDAKKILVGSDVSTPRLELGKPYGSVSIPMGFSKKRDPREVAIMRVLQQEVFTQNTIAGKMPDIIPARPRPFMFLDTADVRVEIFHIKLPKDFSSKRSFSSFKLEKHRFLSTDKIADGGYTNINFRVGMKEAVLGYQKYLDLVSRNLAINPLQWKSELNHVLATFPEEAPRYYQNL